MIIEFPQDWWSFQATVGETVEVPENANEVTILPVEPGSDIVMVTVFAPEGTASDPEARPVETETLERGEPYRGLFHYYPTAVPSPSGESVTVYYLGQTEEEMYTLW